MADGPALLGFADGNMSENDDKICGWSTNKIGGTPNWLLDPPSHYPTCSLCRRLLYLVCQIYCPLSGSVFHRMLYIFGCANMSCWGKNQSWKVLRCQAKDSNFISKKAAENESSSSFEVDDWCDDAEDWGDEAEDILTGLEQCTGNLTLSENKQGGPDSESIAGLITTQPWHESSELCIPCFSPLYVSVVEASEERESSTQLTKHEKKLLSEYQQREGVQVMDLVDGEGVKGWTGETYERASVKHGDKAFHKFNKHLQACPQQCLRYQWNGTPVSMVTTNQSELLSNVPPCQHCGAVRVFETQLMPALVGKLKCAKESNAAHSHNVQQKSQEKLFLQGNNESFSETSESIGLEVTGEISTEDSDSQEKHKRVFLVGVNQMNDVTIEFGTVMVFTCSQSCLKDLENTVHALYLEEFCFVEADPDHKLFE